MRLWKRGPQPKAYAAFGVPTQIDVPDPALWPAVEEILPPGRTECDPATVKQAFGLEATGEDTYTMTIGGAPWVEHATLDVAVGALDQQLRLFIAANAPDFVFVHAGVVAVDGRALLIPGQSFSGKTTLVGALVEAGATYLSDEYAVLDDEGQVHPYARRLSIRSEQGQPLREQHVHELGGTAAESSADVALVLLTRFKRGADWRPEVRTAGDGVVALLANTVPAQERPRESLHAVTRAVRGAQVLEGDRGEARELAPQLMQSLREAPAGVAASR